jgi:hypothetical protein
MISKKSFGENFEKNNWQIREKVSPRCWGTWPKITADFEICFI